ncbi:MAG: isoleucine--tRNA ligase [Patescibacteria group bacterium]
MPEVTNFKQTPNLAELEEQVLMYWRETNAFQKSIDMREGQKSYVFYDGPPFATGLPHYGHLLGSTSKDVIPRYWTMKGYKVERVWGWDCHGLPIENMIEKKLDIKGGKKGIEALGIDKFNDACRTEVLMLDKEWEKIIERLGRWVDFKHNYKTMDKSYMESVWWGFKQLYDKKLVYEGRKVVLYCPRCATPLSNFEIAMDNSYGDVEDNSVYVKFKVNDAENEYFVAWTTTPWTLPGNVALAVKEDAEYVKVEHLTETNTKEYYWFAKNLLPKLEKLLHVEKPTVIETVTGDKLIGKTYQPLHSYMPTEGKRAYEVLAADFVSLEDGTGIVHTAAIYGEDDYALAIANNLPCVPSLDDEGKFLPSVTLVAGQFFKKAEQPIIEDLQKRNLLLHANKITHSYPFCYRCGTPLFYNAVPAWFIDVQQLKPKLMEKNKLINWFPEYLKYGRFGKGLENAPDWNISRSRYWGTPMPIWVANAKEGMESKQYRVIGSIEELRQWAVDPKAVEGLTDIHREFLDEVEVWLDDAKTVKGKRIKEVFDCWVESGSMPFAARHYPFEHKAEFEANYPAQFVSEYIAQTRAWFYTMHVMSVGIFGTHSFENVLTTGTILAEDGSKMSKSKKNYPDPMVIINEFGVDSLRLYLMSSPVMKSENINFSSKEVGDIRKKVFLIWWNIFAFYKQCDVTKVFDPTRHPKPTHVMDRWLMSRVHSTIKSVTQSMDEYNLVKASRTLMDFVNELSTWYLRRSRDRLRTADQNSEEMQTFGMALYTLAQLFAPLTPFFSEVIYHNLVDQTKSIHHTDWPVAQSSDIDEQLEQDMKTAQELSEKIHAQRAEHSIKVRQPLATVTINSSSKELGAEVIKVLLEEVNIKKLNWQSGEALTVTVDTQLTAELKAEGEAREIIRSIQQLRKKSGFSTNDSINLTLSNWPSEWEDKIKAATHATILQKGSEIKIEKIS